MRGLSRRASRPLWLVTLADLALLLTGFFVFLQATATDSVAARAAVSAGIRDAFGGDPAVAPPALALANTRIAFAPGSAAPPPLAAARAWAGEVGGDPRSRVIVTGHDPLSLARAAARAEAVAQALGLPPERIRRAAAVRAGADFVDLSITFEG